MAAEKPTTGIIVAFANTPQAKDDNLAGLGNEDTSSVIYLNVMANDLGGNGKSMWSVDDGISAGGDRPVDLLTKDAVDAVGTTALGAQMWITADGKIAYQTTAALRASLQSLPVGSTASDSFTYAIQMGNGALSWAQANVVLAGTNDAPIVQSVSISAVEDGPAISGSFVGDDVDSDDDVASLKYTLVSQPATGTLANNSNGTFTYDPGSNFQTLAQGEIQTLGFSYTATDKHGAVSTPANGTITVTGANDAPTMQAGSASIVEDGSTVNVNLGALGGDIDSDDDGNTLAYSLLNLPAGGTAGISGTTLTVGPGGSFQGLAQGEVLTYDLGIQAKDKHGAIATNKVAVTVTGVNDAPVVQKVDTFGFEDAGPITAAFSGDDVDSDDNGASLKYAITSSVSPGTLTNNGNGTFTYDPGSNFQTLSKGEAVFLNFDYTATDSHSAVSTPATVSIKVGGTNDAPTMNAGNMAATEDGAPAMLSLATLADDIDNDNDGSNLVYALLGPAPAGNASIAGSTLTFNPNKDFQSLAQGQTQSFNLNVEATDLHNAKVSNTVQVTVTGVNDAPTIAQGTDASGAVTAKAPVSPFTVQQWLNMTSTSLSQLDTWAATLVPNYTVTTGIIDYTDDPVGSAGEIPGSTAWPAAIATGQFGSGASVNNNFFARITGTLNVAVTDTYTFRTWNDDGVFLRVNNSLIISDAGIHPEIVNVGSITLNPGSYPIELYFFEFGGEASLEFTYKNSSGVYGHVNLDPTLRDSGVVLFNDVDLTDAHTVSVAPAGTTKGSLSATVTKDTTGGGTGNVKWDYAVDTNTVTYLGAGESITESFTVTVNDGKGGTAQQAVSVVVNGINDAPVITTTTDEAKGNTKEDTDLTVSGQIKVSDLDVTDTHTWSISQPTSGVYGSASVDNTGKWTYTVNNGTNGVASPVQSLAQGETKIETFTVRASDGKGGNADQVVHVVVAGINDAAVISSQSKTLTETNAAESISGTLTVTDIDSPQNFNAQSLAGQYGNLTLASNGAWTYVMNGAHNEFVPGQNYVDTFSVSSADGTTKASAVTVTIVGSSDGPTAVDDSNSLAASTVVQSTSNVVYWVDWSTVEITGPRIGDAVNGDAPIKVTGTITLGDGHQIGVTYEGLAFLVQANEQKYVYNGAGLNTYEWTQPNSANLPYTSSQVNAPPTTKDIIGLNEAFTGGGFLSANPSRTDFSPRNVTFSEPVDNLFFAVLSMNQNGYKLDQNFQIVSQGQGKYGSQEPEISPTNFGGGQFGIVATGEFHGVLKLDGSVDHITWVSQNKETWNGFTVGTYGKAQTASATGNVLANDIKGLPTSLLEVTNVDGSTMVGNSVTLALPSGATLKVDRDGDYFYDDKGKFSSLLSGQSHTETVSYTVRDNEGYSDTGVLTIVVNGVNDTPVAKADTAAVAEDASVSINVLGNDTDADGHALTVSAFSGGANGGTQLVGNNIVYTPNPNFYGTDTFSYTVQDPTGLTSTASVSVTVNAVNDGPSIKFLPMITNGSFEQPGSSGNFFTGGSTAMTGWTVTGTDIDYIPSTTWQAADGSFSLDLNGFNQGGVKQTLTTVAGQTYTIGFQLSQNNLGSGATVRVAGGSTTKDYVFNLDTTAPGDMKWQGQTFTFTATGATTELSFTSLNSGANGPALDNVVSVATKENTSTTIKGLSVADPDAGTNPINIQLSVAHGALALSSVAGLVALDNNGSDGTIAYAGPQAAINAALASGVIYSPAANYFGADSLAATVNDAGHTGGGNLSASTNVAISVYEVTLPQPISFWLADGNANDSIAPLNNGTLNGGVSFAPGRNGGQSFSFDGTNDYVSVQRELTNDFTVFGWMKTTQTAPAGTQFFHGDGLVYADVGGINNDFGISQVGDRIAFGTGNPDTSIVSSAVVNTGNWVQFAGVRNGSTISLWINGVLQGSINTGNNGALATPPDIIFGANTIDNRYFHGQMDDIQFFDRALTPIEVVGIMNVNPV